MSKSLAQRVLETLPPKTLSEVVEFIAANGSATNIIVKAGRSQSDSQPVVFWPLDHYSDETDRVNALTAISTNAISLDRAVSMYDMGANNYWQELAAMVFGNLADKEFNDTLEEDLKFDFDDATELEDFLPEETVDAIKKSVAYQRLSKRTQTAIIGSVDYLRMLRLFGQAVRDLSKRQSERSSYLGHYGVEVATPKAFTGDTSPEACYLNCRRLKADVMNQVLPSADPQYTGGFKKFFKKAGKALKKIAAPVASVFAPSLAPVLGLIGGKRGEQPTAAEPPTALIGPGAGLSPTAVSADEFLRVNDPRVVILLEVANRALDSVTRAGRPGFDQRMGDILTPDTTGEGTVMLPIIQMPQGDVVITESGVPVTLDHYAANTDYYNGDFKRNFQRRRRVIGRTGSSVAPSLSPGVSITLPSSQVLSLISSLQQALNASGYTGDVDSFVGEVVEYFDSVAEDLPYQGRLSNEQINAAVDRIGAELGMPVLGQVSKILTANRRNAPGFTQANMRYDIPGTPTPGAQDGSRTPAVPTTLPSIKVVGKAISDTLKGVRDAFAAIAGKGRAFSADSRFMKLGSAIMNAMGDLNEEAPPPSGLSDLAE